MYLLLCLLVLVVSGFQGSYQGLDDDYNPVTETVNCDDMYQCIDAICMMKNYEYIHLKMDDIPLEPCEEEIKHEDPYKLVGCWPKRSIYNAKIYCELAVLKERKNYDNTVNYTLKLITTTKETITPDDDNFLFITIVFIGLFMISMYTRSRTDSDT